MVEFVLVIDGVFSCVMISLVATALNCVLVHHGPVVGSLNCCCVLVVLLAQCFKFFDDLLALLSLISLHLCIK